MENLSVQQIEEKIYQVMPPKSQRKVAFLIAKSGVYSCSDDMVNKALLMLASRHDVTTFGDISNWRYSEMMRR